jgi:hypothetical protein
MHGIGTNDPDFDMTVARHKDLTMLVLRYGERVMSVTDWLEI